MTPNVARRFVFLLGGATLVMFTLWMVFGRVTGGPPGDHETRQGDIALTDGRFAAAIERFDAALAVTPTHPGALHGKAAALIGLDRLDEAKSVLDRLIADLARPPADGGPRDVGALAAAFANRGIVKDRGGLYEEALGDYVQAIALDREVAEGPGWLDRLLYHDRKPSSVMLRAQYLYQQLRLPPEQRVLRVPELDQRQRMHKP